MRFPILTLLSATGVMAQTAIMSAGTVIGFKKNNVDNFFGVPYALPPIGPRRLVAPAKSTATFPGGTFSATIQSPTACPQFTASPTTSNLSSNVISTILELPIFPTPQPEGEDCLTLNIQRPGNCDNCPKMPVMVWIYGGGFEAGMTTTYDGANLINQASRAGGAGGNGYGFVFVTMNYRLGGFGWLGGVQLSAEKNTNLGLRDQRAALQWVQDNIAAFGGDPDNVTIMGESAGSTSVFDHLLIRGGNNTGNNGKPLFHGAIMNSASVLPATGVTSAKSQAIFNQVAKAANCPLDAKVLTCLRNLPYATFKSAAETVPGITSYRALDLSFLPRPDTSDNFFDTTPEDALANGKYVKVPIIMGDLEDEGTIFALGTRNITTDAAVRQYIASYYPTANAADIKAFIDTFPDDPAAGSPFRTGTDNQLYPEYKRLSAIFGDLYFNWWRRIVLSQYSSKVRSWAYVGSWLHNFLPVVGTCHAADALEYFGGIPNGPIARTFQTSFASFLYFKDPNAITDITTNFSWPQWNNSLPYVLEIGKTGFPPTNLSNTPDTFRQASFNQFQSLWQAGRSFRL